MTWTLVLPQAIAGELQAAARHHLESAAVLLASIVPADDGTTRLLGRQIHWVPDSSYARREHDNLSILPEGYVNALNIAEQLGAMGLWVHTHPGVDASPVSSKHDRVVDAQIADLFRLRSGSNYYGALTVSTRAHGIAFTGHLESQDRTRVLLNRIWEVGSRFKLTRSSDSPLRELSPIFDRNIRAFGGAIQQTLADLRVGIVGCGGTGSAVAEQLVRLGVRDFVLVDPDDISSTNITRVYGSVITDVGRPKVTTLAAHLRRIAPETRLESVGSMLTMESAARRLLSRDMVFGCTDDNAGRLVLSRIATYLLTPVIDCGILLTNDADGNLIGIDGRVTVLSPGDACLICRGRVDVARAGAELLTPTERVRRADEGYAPALGNIEPAVVPYTTLVAATAVAELLERLIGYGPDPRPSEVLLRCHDREVSTNVATPRERHYCHPASGKLGIGLVEPFLDQTWPG